MEKKMTEKIKVLKLEDDEHRVETETQIGITLATLGEVIKW